MTQDQAKPAVLRLFREWVDDNCKTIPYADAEGGFIFYSWLRKEHPEVLAFRARGDKWQTVHGWLLNARLVTQ